MLLYDTKREFWDGIYNTSDVWDFELRHKKRNIDVIIVFIRQIYYFYFNKKGKMAELVYRDGLENRSL